MRASPGPRTTAAPLLVTLSAALLLTACSETSDDPLGVRFPLFEDLDEAAFDASCLAFRVDQAQALDKGEKLFSKAPPEIDWADDVYAAIERAKREDKPIFLQTHCRENADPDCDV
jgi:hypothetical protein